MAPRCPLVVRCYTAPSLELTKNPPEGTVWKVFIRSGLSPNPRVKNRGLLIG